jgi:hypothetical protein
MCHRMRTICASFLFVISVIFYAGSGANGEDSAWRVSKSSGDVSVITLGAQQAALTDGAVLKPFTRQTASSPSKRIGQGAHPIKVRHAAIE